ncbi:hypothetical protein L7F22_023261 [Adiantum nelumboides]|nr:hypothetical protein [Adiantum nelumboides]
MVLVSESYYRLRTRRICFACLLFFQLAWILPCTYFLLSQSSAPRMLILQDRNTSRRINTQGFSGAVKILSDTDLAALNKIHNDWNAFLPTLKKRLSLKGFVQSPERSCFLWLPECLWFAKHERILQIVKEAIGPRVLLYGMTLWKGRNEVLQRFHRNAEVGDCEKLVNVVFGASVQLVSQSHKIPERLLQAVLKHLLTVEEESLTFANKQEEFEFLERSFIARIKRIVRSPDVWLENLILNNNHGVFFHGGTLHRIGEVLENGTGVLLQFISADCKVREAQTSVWGSQGTSHNLYLPPTLLVAGERMELGVVNDVRLSLSRDDSLLSRLGNKKQSLYFLGRKRRISIDDVKPPKVSGVRVFSETNATFEWKNEGVWRMRKIGEASTTVMAKGRIERLLLGSMSSTVFGKAAGAGEQVIVVLSEGLLYVRSVKEADFQHYELLELRPGSAALLSKKLMQAVLPLDSEVGIMSLYWIGHDNLISNKRSPVQVKALKATGRFGTKATEGCTITLGSGQAYDPDNNEFCDVIIFMVEGYLLQVLPSNITLQAYDVLLIPAHQPCILWNIGGLPVKFFAMHLCRVEDDMQVMTSFGASGKVF